MTACAQVRIAEKIAAESVVGEGGKKDRSGVRAKRCRARRSTRSFRFGEMGFMPRWSVVESEVGFRQR